MAHSHCVFLLLALVFVVQVLCASGAMTLQPMGGEGSVTVQECPSKCDYRCSETHHRKPCLFFCNYCCQRCLCVPSGTSGNKQECPCYNNMKNKRGGTKVPLIN